MVRTDRFKYVQYRGDATDQLFDMQSDPWETKNLFGDASFGPTVEGHRKLLADWESRLEIHPEPEGGDPAALHRRHVPRQAEIDREGGQRIEDHEEEDDELEQVGEVGGHGATNRRAGRPS